jgi:hypothetical protein
MRNYQISESKLLEFKETHQELIDFCSTINYINSNLSKFANILINSNLESNESEVKDSIILLHNEVERFHDDYSGVNIQLVEVDSKTLHFENVATMVQFEISYYDILRWSNNLNNLELYKSELVKLIEIKKEYTRKQNERELKRKNDILAKKNAEMEKLKLEMDKLNSEIEKLNK